MVGVSPPTSSFEMMISSPASAINWMTGVVCGMGTLPAVPPPWMFDFCFRFCAPASIVSRPLTPVPRCRIVTPALKGSRRYFQLASGRESSWFAVSAMDHVKSGIWFGFHSLVRQIDAVGRRATLARLRHDVAMDVEWLPRTEQLQLLDQVGDLRVSQAQDLAPPRAARGPRRRRRATPLPTPRGRHSRRASAP